MERPAEICEVCFENSRLTHNAGDGDELIGVFCTHSKTGAVCERQGDVVLPWRIVQESNPHVFWTGLRLSAQYCRGEITKAGLVRAMLQGGRRR